MTEKTGNVVLRIERMMNIMVFLIFLFTRCGKCCRIPVW